MPEPQGPRTVNAALLDRSISHTLFVQRYGSQLTGELVGFLDEEVFPDVLGRLQKRIEQMRLRGYDSGVTSTKRYAQLLADLRGIMREGGKEATKRLRRAARALAKIEGRWQQRALFGEVPNEVHVALSDSLNVPLVQRVVGQPIRGRVLEDWWRGLGDATQQQMQAQIGVGLAEGETAAQIIQRVRGTRRGGFADGVLGTARRQAESIVRTTVNHVSTQAREETYGQMGDAVKGVQWVSTLDTRTTPICMRRDGRVYPVGKGPRPPAHWGCRSTTVPVLRSFRELLGKRDRARVSQGTRASMNGQVPESLTYAEWIKRQPAAVQDQALGVRRARLFRAGRISIADLSTSHGRPVTLEELEESE